MHWRNLKWARTLPPVDDTVIEEVEEFLGIKFPNDYRECAKVCHGGTPSPGEFVVYSLGLVKFASCLGYLCSLNKGDPQGILNTALMLEDVLPNGLVPFAGDGGGDLICFRYTEQSLPPSIVYYQHELSNDEAIVHLADTFTDFVNLLEGGSK